MIQRKLHIQRRSNNSNGSTGGSKNAPGSSSIKSIGISISQQLSQQHQASLPSSLHSSRFTLRSTPLTPTASPPPTTSNHGINNNSSPSSAVPISLKPTYAYSSPSASHTPVKERNSSSSPRPTTREPSNNSNSNSNDAERIVNIPYQEQQQAYHQHQHYRKRKRGELIFHSNFESGNLGKVKTIKAECEYELSIRPDTNNPNYRLWYYFSVENCKKNQRVVLSIVNFSKARSLYRQGMTPLVKSDQRPYWQRIPEKQVFYYRNPKSKSYILSFVFVFDRETDVYYFSYSYPYT